MTDFKIYPIEDIEDSTVKEFTDYLLKNKLTVSVAESCTSGLVAKTLTDRSGSSAYFWGGVASYDNNAKIKLLNVREQTLAQFGAVSEQTAIEMASGIRKISDSDLSISLTGIAGPGGAVNGKPVGTVYIGFASKKYKPVVVLINIKPKNRDYARRCFTIAAVYLAFKYIQGTDIVDIAENLSV